MKVSFFWDFYGPRAKATAEHFISHLGEFMESYEIKDCTLSVESVSDVAWIAKCVAPQAHRDLIEKTLRPKRILEENI